MNLKRAKHIRRLCRQFNREPTERSYLRHNTTGVVIVNPQTGRGFYLSLKRIDGLAV